MTTNIPQTMYIEEFVPVYEQHQSLLRQTVNTAAMVSGLTAQWVVDGSGSGSAVTRASNGLIPARSQSTTPKTATLVEWHDKPTITRFDEFCSQGSIRNSMIRTQVTKLNTQIDTEILALLATGTTFANSAAAIASVSLFARAAAKLQAQYVVNDGNIFAALSPAAWQYLIQAPEFSNSQWVNASGMTFVAGGDVMQYAGSFKFKDVGGVKYFMHPMLATNNTSELCYVYHKDAIGHAMDNGGIPTVVVGFNEEHDYPFVRASMFSGGVLLQNAGIVVVRHDGSILA